MRNDTTKVEVRPDLKLDVKAEEKVVVVEKAPDKTREVHAAKSEEKVKSEKSGLSTTTSSSMMAAPTAAAPPQTVETPSEKKYREGLEQASQSRLDEAEVTLRESVRMDPSKPEYLCALAKVLLSNPRYERAGTLPVVRSLLDRAVTLSPNHAEASDMHRQIVSEMGG
jgi:predicted Zn-dependent protease